MPRVIGRDRELNEALGAVHAAKRDGIARFVRITGPSGIGKTALMQAVLCDVEPGWLVATTSALRIQARLPQFVARRVSSTLVENLGEEATRYTSGLPEERSPDDTAQRLLRLVEGVSMDRPLLFAVDDAQWCDRESLATFEGILTSLAGRPFVFLATDRTGESAFSLDDVTLHLGSIDRMASRSVVAEHFPGASHAVIEAIVERAQGNPVDLIAISGAAREIGAVSADDVEASLRATIARRVSNARPELREFLQLCALIEEPIPNQVLQQLYSDDSALDALIAAGAANFVMQGPDGLRFVHSSVAQSVRETIAIDIPFRRRILSALERIPEPDLEMLERIVDQARAAADRTTEARYLAQLADAAFDANALHLGTQALERLIATRQLEPHEIVPIYGKLAQVYNGTGMEQDGLRAAEAGLQAAARAGVRTGRGTLVASMILAQTHSGARASAQRTVERYARELDDPQDRAHVLTSAMTIAAHAADRAAFDALKSETDALPDVPTFARFRMLMMEAAIAVRQGDRALALSLFADARPLLTEMPPFAWVMLSSFSAIGALHDGGIPAFDAYVSESDDWKRTSDFMRSLFQLLFTVLQGDHDEAVAMTAEALIGQRGLYMQRSFLGLAALSSALTGGALPAALETRIESEALRFSRGERSAPLVPLSAAAAAILAPRDARRARTILHAAAEEMTRAQDATVFVFEPILAIAAQRLDDTSTLRAIAEGRMYADNTPWSQTLHAIAAGLAGAPVPKTVRDDAATLGIGRLYEAYAGRAAAENRTARGAGPTRREGEIAKLVSQGLSNREIAERLVLSERTVESHIANAFAKLNVSSRTQLATWAMANLA